MKRWFTPAPVETVEAVCEPYAGGRFYTVMRLPDGQELAGESCYLVVEPERLVWTNTMTQGFRPAAPRIGSVDFAMTAELRFTPEAGGIRYQARVMHASAQDRQTHADMGFTEGWTTCAEQLAALMRAA